MTPLRKAGMLIEMMPDMNWATERKTEVMFTANPVCAKRVLNYLAVRYEARLEFMRSVP